MDHPTNSRRRRRRRGVLSYLLGYLFLTSAILLVGVLLAVALAPRPAANTDSLSPSDSGWTSSLSAPAQKGTVPIPDPTSNTTDDRLLVLVNPWNPLPEDWSVTLVELKNNMAVDEQCYPDLQSMMDACRAEGMSPLICSSYRTQAYQEQLFQSQALPEDGSAGMAVALPGTSEHQTGLAVDIVDQSYQLLDEAQENTPVQQWLMAHSWEYGFILRYPTGKNELTGIIYEPWHYRYVGREAASQIHALNLCLEEYLAKS